MQEFHTIMRHVSYYQCFQCIFRHCQQLHCSIEPQSVPSKVRNTHPDTSNGYCCTSKKNKARRRWIQSVSGLQLIKLCILLFFLLIAVHELPRGHLKAKQEVAEFQSSVNYQISQRRYQVWVHAIFNH